ANSLNNIGNIYAELSNYEDALEYYKKSLKIKEEIKDKKGIANTLNNIGELYSKLGNFSEALFYCSKSLEIAESLNVKDIIIDNYESFSETYSAMGNYKKAFEHYKQYTALKDSVFNLETYKQIAEIKTKYETEKKDKQIQALEYENDINNIKINHHKKTHIIYITGLLLTIAAIKIILIQYRKKNMAYKFLVRKNIDLLKKDKELKDTKKQTILNKTDNNDKKITISNDEKEKILRKLEKLFETKKIFTRHNLTINKLAKKISTNRNYLSKIIKEEFGKNYNDFINEYRVNEAMFILSDPLKNKVLSIEAIGNNAGYKTKSSFYLAFKKITGVTPSVFIDNI
ncbi:MAG: tetratricopeptide repeat protein, partial [Bacteroidales bacterium]|nr:tetratricopeptide repeat protein [Bacteroidales bacterium]